MRPHLPRSFVSVCLLARLPVVLYSAAHELILRKSMYQSSRDTVRHMFRALDAENRGFIQFDDLRAALTSDARQSHAMCNT
jgi:hypothetical protein